MPYTVLSVILGFFFAKYQVQLIALTLAPTYQTNLTNELRSWLILTFDWDNVCVRQGVEQGLPIANM